MPNLASDVDDWVPDLLVTNWESTVRTLEAEGTDVLHESRPIIAGAKDRASGGSVKGVARVKAYESGERTHEPNSVGYTDRDRRLSVDISVQYKGSNPADVVNSARLVIDRILEDNRVNPQADWDLIETWTSRKSDDFPDFHKVIFTLTLAKYGELLSTLT